MHGTSLVAMAWRNLWRNSRRTLITLVSFSLGVMLAILFTGMGDASYGRLIELAARLGSGHVAFQHPEYLEKPALERRISDVPKLLEQVRANPEVGAAVERITGAAMVATASNSIGGMFMAIDPTQENTTTLAVLSTVSEGEFLRGPEDKGVIVGSGMAEALELTIGKKMVYTLTDPNGEIVSGLTRVRGIIKTGTTAVDASLFILAIDPMRKRIGFAPDEATMVAVFGRDHRNTEALFDACKAMAQEGTGVYPWNETQADLAGFIAIDRAGNIFFQSLIMLLVSAGIFNSLFISVMERSREFGIMLALGFSTRQLFALVLLESGFLGLAGLALTAVFTAWPYHYMATTGVDLSAMVGENYEVSGIGMDPRLVVDIQPDHLVIIAGLSFMVTLVAGLFPAYRAGRFEPVETIRVQ